MRVLALKVLGALEFSADGQPLSTYFRSDKVRALLVYLALEAGRPQQRRFLAALLWPDFPEKDGLRNLRKALFHLRETIDQVSPKASQSWLTVDRQIVQFNPTRLVVDAIQFEQLLAEVEQHNHHHLHSCADCLARLVEAEAHYRDELARGLSLANAIDFEEWLLFRREQLQQRALLALQNLATIYEQQKEYEEVERYATRLILLDPYHEKAVRQLMRVFTHTDRRSVALQLYNRLADRLQSEIGVEPEAKTSRLYKQILADDLLESVPAVRKLHHFPTQFTPFLGRKEELAQVSNLLLDTSCRLLTIIGPGGIGKTRLAVEAAKLAAEGARFADGIYFVHLSVVENGDDLLTTLATALSLQPRASTPLLEQILDFLKAKGCLLVLDNFEQLVSEAMLLTDIVAEAPDVQLLVTSRFALNVRAEQRILLSGLALPHEDASEEDVAANSSVRLFVESARRVSLGFRLTEKNQSAVIQICHLVVGMPLALEIAGAWTRLMSEAAIAAEIQQNIDFLATPMKDLPERHRSMTAVFTYSWKLLSSLEQMALAQLSVFQDGFSMQTAVSVTGASLATLGNLLDYSLLQRTANGRYEMHRMTRQFAEQKLASLAIDNLFHQQIHDRHSDYYLAYIAKSESDLYGATPHITVSALQQRWQNICNAWQWAISQQHWSQLDKSIDALGYFCVLSGLVHKGAALFDEATQGFTDITTHTAELWGKVQIWQAHFLFRLGEIAEALTTVYRTQKIAHDENLTGLQMRALTTEAKIKYLQSEYPRALACLQTAIAYYEDKREKRNLADACGTIGYVYWQCSHYTEAKTYLEKGLALQVELENVAGQAQLTNVLGAVFRRQGELAAATDCYRQALLINQTLGYEDGIAQNLTNLSIVLKSQGKFDQALALNLEAEKSAKKRGYLSGIARLNGNRASIYLGMGLLEEARACRQLASELDEALGNSVGLARHWGGLGYIYKVQKKFDQAMVCFDWTIAVLRELALVNHLASYLLFKAEILVEQSDYEVAYALATEGLQLAQQFKQTDKIVSGHIILARIEHAQGHVEQARQRVYDQLSGTETEALAASLHFALWQIGAGLEHAEKAATLYSNLYSRIPDYRYKLCLEALDQRHVNPPHQLG